MEGLIMQEVTFSVAVSNKNESCIAWVLCNVPSVSFVSSEHECRTNLIRDEIWNVMILSLRMNVSTCASFTWLFLPLWRWVELICIVNLSGSMNDGVVSVSRSHSGMSPTSGHAISATVLMCAREIAKDTSWWSTCDPRTLSALFVSALSITSIIWKNISRPTPLIKLSDCPLKVFIFWFICP